MAYTVLIPEDLPARGRASGTTISGDFQVADANGVPTGLVQFEFPISTLGDPANPMPPLVAFESTPVCIADLVAPFGLLDLADISAFVSGFIAEDPIADLDGNDLFDLNDVSVFVGAFTAGCP